MSAQKVLLACCEVPEAGGASAAAYHLFSRLQADGAHVALVNLVAPCDEAYFDHCFAGEHGAAGNPAHLDDVYNCVVHEHKTSAELTALIERECPEVMLAVGSRAVGALHRAAPATKLIFLATSCAWMDAYICRFPGSELSSMNANELASPWVAGVGDAAETEAIAKADLILAGSANVYDLYRKLYDGYAGKLQPSGDVDVRVGR